MPQTQVVFSRDSAGDAPVLTWLRQLRREDRKAWANCLARVQQLAATGHELRRPAADYLRDGIYELRAKHGRVQYRMLYFFHGRNIAVLAHAMIKSGSAVPKIEIQRALTRKQEFEQRPAAHTFEMEIDNG